MTTEELREVLMDFPASAEVVVEGRNGELRSMIKISYTGADYRDFRMYESDHGPQRVLILRTI